MQITAIYFSGTGNTQWITEAMEERFHELGDHFQYLSIENWQERYTDTILRSDMILFGYPIYGSAPPQMMRDFYKQHKALFLNKRCGIYVTQYLFSGDGGAYFANLLRKDAIEVVDIAHFFMPNNISDLLIFPVKNGFEIHQKLREASRAVQKYAQRIHHKRFKKTGDQPASKGLGLLQRGPFLFGEMQLKKMIKIDHYKCVTCNRCVMECPTKNLYLKNDEIGQNGNCTLCYRCINLCPQKAISLFSVNKPRIQYKGPFYQG